MSSGAGFTGNGPTLSSTSLGPYSHKGPHEACSPRALTYM